MAEEGKINDSTRIEERNIDEAHKEAKIRLVAELKAREDIYAKSVVDFEEAKKEVREIAKLRQDLGDDTILPAFEHLIKHEENIKVNAKKKETAYFDFVMRITHPRKEKREEEDY